MPFFGTKDERNVRTSQNFLALSYLNHRGGVEVAVCVKGSGSNGELGRVRLSCEEALLFAEEVKRQASTSLSQPAEKVRPLADTEQRDYCDGGEGD